LILDAANVSSAGPLRARVCIVGAGAAGISMALELGAAGVDVLVLEAGGEKHDAAAHDIYRGTVVDPTLHNPLEDHRARTFGGTTTMWGGRCVPYDPIDFEDRPWMNEARWPIAYADVAKFYPRANQLCEAGAFDYSATHVFGAEQRPMIAGFAGEAFSTDTLERFSCPTNFAGRYREKLSNSPNIRVLLHAAVADIVTDAAGTTVQAVALRMPGGGSVRVEAEEFVVAMGGLETTRLLLASRSVHRDGIGNEHGNLGRYYMAHIAGTVGEFAPVGGPDAVDNNYQIADDGAYCRRRLALRPEAQREHRVGGFIARLHHTRIADPSHGSSVLSALRLGSAAVPKRFRNRLADERSSMAHLAKHAANVVRDLPALAAFAKQMVFDRKLAARKFPSVVVRPRSNRYSLDFHAEQEPNFHSQVRLSATERDAHGMPRLEVEWRYGAKDVETIATALRLFAADAERSHSGVFAYDAEHVEAEMTRYGAYGGHHLGTARMGSEAATSVVDADCRVHGIRNLYVAGGAVFSTSSQANPTLTVVALALRLAHHLRQTQRYAMEVTA
jgi:choline dehydrogenase-like flavoprotein